MKYFLVLVTTLLLLLLLTPPSARAAQTRGDNFESVPCTTFKLSDSTFQCGYVRVPELHAQPDGAQIKLGVAILPSPDASPTQDAFLVAQGGPGGSTLDTFASFFAQNYYPAIETLRATRDIVMYDQRGTLYAQPALTCPEELDLTLATIEQNIPESESLAKYQDAVLACRARLVSQGINLSAYNSIENALDMQDVQRALGYQKFDLYGVSYGTLLALHALRQTPDLFRSVILDAVVPAQINPNSAIAASENRAFEELFTRCAADADCNNAYPDLKTVFYAQVDKLNATPARVPLTDADTGKTYNAVLDGDTFMSVVFQFIYDSELIPILPRLVYDARDGHYPLIEAFYPLLLFDRTFAGGMYYSVMCAEDADFTINDLALDGVDPHIAKSQTRDTASFLELCQKWNVPQLGPSADAPVRANVPTLVLSGDFDPITPPPFGQTAAATISPSYVFEFPAYGHGALTSGNCPNQIIAAFVRDPSRAPDALCIKNQAAKVRFVTPTNTLISEGIGKIQYAMLQLKLQPLLVPIVLIVILLSVWLVAPLTWLIRRSQKRPAETQRLVRLAPWLSALASLVAVAFFAILFVLLVIVAFQNQNTIALVVGPPHEWLPLFLLPSIFTLCALALTAALVIAWRRNSWGLGSRIYFSLLTLAALGLVAWFAFNGMLLPFFS